MSTVTQAATAPSTQEAPDTPRTYTFTSTVTGEQVTVTCMPGCTLNHAADGKAPTHPDDIYCHIDGAAIELPLYGPMCETGRPEEFAILSWHIGVRQFANRLAQRMPYVEIEAVDDHWIEALDPDALATVIGKLQQQIDSLRAAHTQLVTVRAAYRSLPEVTA